ncbi:hypothetical protein PIB30_089962 [Stylosanthes scabra]|uniref:Putative plant transposon protein domain-containing protein n=1 Tax=Stylosanthes scabra TaxID=79078 RepID=A0ABU6WXG7_9FABA|nr:hypothetical protein [Stylosanthes scabra]
MFSEGTDTFEEWILARGWDFMYEPSTPINLSWVREFYANRAKKNQREVFIRGKKIPCFLDTIEKVLNVPKFKGRCGYSDISSAYNKNELDMDEVLRVICKKGATWWEDPRAHIIPARPKKKILNNEAWMWLKLIWHEEDKEVAHPIPLPIPSLVPPPAVSTDIPAPSTPSSPELLRTDLMRALRRNERNMRRHEQLMPMLHLGLDTLGLKQISFLDISQNQQEQGARSAGRVDGEEEDDFQSAKATANDD